MTDKEVRKLKRADLIEILFYLQKELETVQQENEKLRKQLENIEISAKISDEDVQRIAKAVKAAMRTESNDTLEGESKKHRKNGRGGAK